MTYYFWLGKEAEPLTYMIDTADWRMIVGSAEAPAEWHDHFDSLRDGQQGDY